MPLYLELKLELNLQRLARQIFVSSVEKCLSVQFTLWGAGAEFGEKITDERYSQDSFYFRHLRGPGFHSKGIMNYNQM